MNNQNNADQDRKAETESGQTSFLYTIEADGAISPPRRCCPYCHMEFSWDEYEDHNCRGHDIVNTQARQPTIFRVSRKDSIYAAINQKAAHKISDKKKINKKKMKKKRGRKKNKNKKNNRYQGQGAAKYESDRYEQDGSKNIGYVCRENGRYGSFPMHDDYSDEAQP